MAAAQAALIADTIADMTKRISRGDGGSDSDELIHKPTNRGNKLKRKAQYVHDYQLDYPSGPKVYKRKIEHAGYQRYIISRNPPRLDADGDKLDDEEVDEEADAAAREQNPYADVTLERILAPLTSAAELPNHPTLVKAYTSTALPELTAQACDMLHQERASLFRMKQLLTKFRGDEMWVPCGALETPNDFSAFNLRPVEHRQARTRPRHDRSKEAFQEVDLERVPYERPQSPARNGANRAGDQATVSMETDPRRHEDDEAAQRDPGTGDERPVNGQQKEVDAISGREIGPDGETQAADMEKRQEESKGEHPLDADGDGMDVDSDGPLKPEVVDNDKEPGAERGKDGLVDGIKSEPPTNADSADLPAERRSDAGPKEVEKNAAQEGKEVKEQPQEQQADAQSPDQQPPQPPPAHHMTTRRQAHAASGQHAQSPNLSDRSTPSLPPSSKQRNLVNPIFTIPPEAHPEDRDFGLPPVEAEETRRLLLLYVQKQEEVCRGATQLYEGLLKACRWRSEVYKACKAEAHVGEMSDGEDWYDRQEWGLEGDLKKGMDEDDEDGHMHSSHHQSHQHHQQQQQQQQQQHSTLAGAAGIGAGKGAAGGGDAGATLGGGGGLAGGVGTAAGMGGIGMGNQAKKTRTRRA